MRISDWSSDVCSSDLRALRVHVEPTQWSGADWSLGKEQAATSIEGFWIPRPWSTSDACPRRSQPGASGTETVLLPGQTLAVAQFTGDDERGLDNVQSVTPAAFDVLQGLRLRLSGGEHRVTGGGAECGGSGGRAEVCTKRWIWRGGGSFYKKET